MAMEPGSEKVAYNMCRSESLLAERAGRQRGIVLRAGRSIGPTVSVCRPVADKGSGSLQISADIGVATAILARFVLNDAPPHAAQDQFP